MAEIFYLKKVSTYAKLINASATHVKNLANSGKIATTAIDGVLFIDILKFPPQNFLTKK
tara:strand:- start:276 stop:452 length:177 start_codon:yes stop_codon:yes gene_type:complete